MAAPLAQTPTAKCECTDPCHPNGCQNPQGGVFDAFDGDVKTGKTIHMCGHCVDQYCMRPNDAVGQSAAYRAFGRDYLADLPFRPKIDWSEDAWEKRHGI